MLRRVTARGASLAAAPNAYDLAFLPLPRALHLLTALSADLYSAGQRDQAYQVCLQSLQVLERIVHLQQAALAAQTASAKPTRTEDASPLTHRHFLSAEFLADLERFLQAQAATDTPNQLPPALHTADLIDEAAAAFYNMSVCLHAAQQNVDDAKKCRQQAKAIARWMNA